jgi:phage terminase small subunit
MDQLDPIDIMTDDGGLKPLREWPKAWRTSISSMDVTELWEGVGDARAAAGVLKKLTWPKKDRIIELIGKHVGVQAWKEKEGPNVNLNVGEIVRTIVDTPPRRSKDPDQ